MEKHLDGTIIRDERDDRNSLVCNQCLRVGDKIVVSNPKPGLKNSHEPADHICNRCNRTIEIWEGYT